MDEVGGLGSGLVGLVSSVHIAGVRLAQADFLGLEFRFLKRGGLKFAGLESEGPGCADFSGCFAEAFMLVPVIFLTRRATISNCSHQLSRSEIFCFAALACQSCWTPASSAFRYNGRSFVHGTVG